MSQPQERKLIELEGKFDFAAGVTDRNAYGKYDPTYVVELPHMCGPWEITSTQDKATAVADLEAFIAEANKALDVLREAEL